MRLCKCSFAEGANRCLRKHAMELKKVNVDWDTLTVSLNHPESAGVLQKVDVNCHRPSAYF